MAARARTHSAGWPSEDNRRLLALILLTLRVPLAALPLITGGPLPAGPGLHPMVQTAILVAGNVGALIVSTGRVRRFGPLPAMAADFLLTYAVMLALGTGSDGSVRPFAGYLAVTVALWTAAAGRIAGLLTAVSLLLLPAVSAVIRPAGSGAPLTAASWALLAVLLLTGLAAPALAAHAAVRTAGSEEHAAAARTDAPAYADGVRAGREQERRETHRWLHDGVLQTFEVIRLSAGRHPSAETLAEIRALAAENAEALRRTITEPPAPPGRLPEALTELVSAERLLGLHVDLEIAGLPPGDLPPVAVAALRDATAEALRNVRKHAGTTSARLRARCDRTTVGVEVCDEGAGFDPRRQPPGFGLRHSVAGRLRDAGGGCAVSSDVGGGTRVHMWISR